MEGHTGGLMRIHELFRHLVLAALLAVPYGQGITRGTAQPIVVSAQATKPDDKSRTVYITRTGKKYHSANCRYLNRSKIPTKLSDAIRAGLSACSVCGGG